MEMSPLQIASEYRTAANKSKQIKVLAELNCVTQRQIAQLLADQGEELPGHWKEKLATPLKREPVSDRYLREAIVEALTPETNDTSSASPRSAPSPQGEGKEVRIATPACATVRNDRAALSLDEIRQAALRLILEAAPSEPERFQGFARGVAALVQELEERSGNCRYVN